MSKETDDAPTEYIEWTDESWRQELAGSPSFLGFDSALRQPQQDTAAPSGLLGRRAPTPKAP